MVCDINGMRSRSDSAADCLEGPTDEDDEANMCALKSRGVANV